MHVLMNLFSSHQGFRSRVALSFAYLLTLTCICTICMSLYHPEAKKKVVIGYVGGYRGLVDAAKIDASKLSIINYAFVDVQGNRAFLTNGATDTTNFRLLNTLKLVNPDLKLVIS